MSGLALSVLGRVIVAQAFVLIVWALAIWFAADRVGALIAGLALATCLAVAGVIDRSTGASASPATERPSRVTREVAEHEGAHAVVMHALGGADIHLIVPPDGSVAAYVRSALPLGATPVDEHWISLVSRVAGHVYDLAHDIHTTVSLEDLRLCAESAFAIMSIGDRPSGYVGPLTAEALDAAAREKATAILEERQQNVLRLAGLFEGATAEIGPDQVMPALAA